MNTVLIIFSILIFSKFLTEMVLNLLNRKELFLNQGAVPMAFCSFIDQETYDRSLKYNAAKNAFDRLGLFFDTGVLGLIIVTGVLPWLFDGITGYLGVGLWAQSLAVVIILILIAVPSIPFDWWQQFHLEERFGFNRSSPGLWVMDKLKAGMLCVVIGVPILWVLLRFFQAFPGTWWLWGFFAFFGFQILMLLFYPMIILPLFNKLKPLEEGELRGRLMKLAKKTGFAASTIEVMDGSKRSGHSNAFFTGMGRFRRIVLFDTLIEQLEPTELESVLAHEIGHYKCGHVPKMLLLSAISLLGGFYALSFLMEQSWFLTGFGFHAEAGVAPALLLFVMLAGLVTFWVSPLMHALSRKHEYEADAFSAKAMGSSAPLLSSLHKLSEKNLSNLTPHPAFSAFYYSHPTLLEREKALKKYNARS